MRDALEKNRLTQITIGILFIHGALISTVSRADTSANGGNELEEITVTAQRREENLQKVPIAVTVLSSNDLERQNIVSQHDLNAHVPSMSVGSQSVMRESAVYQIRGLGQTLSADPSVVTYLAEVPTVGVGPGFLYDLQNVQVLRGPQGTLFGRSTTGGAVLLQPQKPGDDYDGYIDVSLGDYNLRRVQGAVDLPLIPGTLLTRLAIDSNRRDGYTTDVVTGAQYDGRDYTALRFSMVAKPFDGFENYTLLDWAQANNTESGTILEGFNPTGLVGTVFPNLAADYAAQQARGIRETNLGTGPYYQDTRNWGGTNISTYELNDAIKLKNIVAYRYYSYRIISNDIGSPEPIIVEIPYPAYGAGAVSLPSQRQITEEAQIQGKALDSRLTYIGGVYYEHTKPESGNTADLVVQFGAPIVLESLKYGTTKAAYGQGAFDFTDSLKLTVGARYSADGRSQVASNFISSPLTGCTFTPPAPVDCRANASADFHATTWNVSLDEQVTPDTLLYASAKRGYKSGGFNATSPSATDRVFQPEFVITGELGIKNQFDILNMPGRVSLDVYKTWFKDLQETGTFTVGTVTLNGIINAGRGYIEGVELEGSIKPTPWFTLSGFYAFTNPVYTNNEIPGVGNLTDQPFYNVPKHKGSLTASFDHSLGDSVGTAEFSATYTYQTKVYFQESLLVTFMNPNRGQNSYGLLNLHAALNEVGGRPLDLGVFVTNVANKAYKVFEWDDYDVLGFASAIYSEPRMWGVDFRYRFGGNSK